MLPQVRGRRADAPGAHISWLQAAIFFLLLGGGFRCGAGEEREEEKEGGSVPRMRQWQQQ